MGYGQWVDCNEPVMNISFQIKARTTLKSNTDHQRWKSRSLLEVINQRDERLN
jgi:hypothetical protein